MDDRPHPVLLVVEDDVLVAMTLRDELEEAGYIVMDLTERHQEALSAARQGRPDLALVNIELQGRDDGIALAQDLKALGVPVLLISGQASRVRSARTAAIASLPKPYDAPDMVLAVNYLMAKLKGLETPTKPEGLEVFAEAAAVAQPDET